MTPSLVAAHGVCRHLTSVSRLRAFAECRPFAADVTAVGAVKTALAGKQTVAVRTACRFVEAIVQTPTNSCRDPPLTTRRRHAKLCHQVFTHQTTRVSNPPPSTRSEGGLGGLLKEGRTIQHQFTRQRPNQSRSAQQTTRRFAKLMMEGKVRAALRLIDDDESGGPLHLDSQIAFDGSCTPSETVREVLLKKHPPKQPPKPSSIITPDSPTIEPHPVLFGRIDGQLIRSSALRTDGAAGPSGLDAAAWKRMCTSFKSASADLCDSLASTTRRICSCFVDPRGLSAFVACRLIALDKRPGVRPIGVGETSRRIVGRAIVASISDDIQDAAGPLQVCAGHLSECEAAVHAMRQISEAPDTDAIILVDASNAFNSLNRQAALRNIHKLCPALSKALINTY